MRHDLSYRIAWGGKVDRGYKGYYTCSIHGSAIIALHLRRAVSDAVYIFLFQIP